MEANLSYLSPLSVDRAVGLLEHRFASSLPYTAAHDSSKVIIAVNPLREIPGMNGEESWWRSDSKVGQLSENNENTQQPHVYDVSAAAMQRMQAQNRKKQTIIISGESGAGKTVHTTLLLEHIAKRNGNGRASLMNRTLAANPVMEAFGNASTAANENSSRFGKMLVLKFDNKGLKDATVRTFLFERTRVMNHPATERNFHIFYQLLAGVASYGPRLKASLGVLQENTPEHFAILRREGSSIDLDWQRDRLEAARTLRALSCLGISQQERMNLMHSLTSILHLGNITFCSDNEDGSASGVIANSSYASAVQAARLLGLESVRDLETCLCERTVSVRGENILMRNSVQQCLQVRDALGQELYSRMFRWLIELINQGNSKPDDEHQGVISLLDVMGFEVQRSNELEQLLINFCNEKLQHEFSRTMIFQVQQEYLAEGIACETVASSIQMNPTSTLSVFDDAAKGLWALLDQECHVPGGSDTGFVRKLGRAHPQGGHLETGKLLKAESFVVHHFAGRVEYTAQGILEKSVNAVNKSVQALLDEKSSQGKFFVPVTPSAKLSSIQRTVGLKFKNELESLLNELSSANDVAWVRCIRPNASKNPDEFDRTMVARQIQASGVIPAVALARSAWPHQMRISDFYSRFSCVLNKLDKSCMDQLTFGKTRVYCDHATMQMLQCALDEHIRHRAILILQRQARGWRQRLAYQRKINAIKVFQSRFRFKQHLKARAAIVAGMERLLDESHLQVDNHDVSSISGSSVSTMDDGDHVETSFSFAPPEQHETVVDVLQHDRVAQLELEAEENARIVTELTKEVQRLRAAALEATERMRCRAVETATKISRAETKATFFKPAMSWKVLCHTQKHWSETETLKDIVSLLVTKETGLYKRGSFTTGGLLALMGSKVEDVIWQSSPCAAFSSANGRMEIVHDWVLDAIGAESDWSDSE